MRVYAGLRPAEWQGWGQFTTFKSNAPELLERSLRPDQVIYCSPLVDPYQAAEETEAIMPAVLDAVIARPPRVFTIQTRGPLILRDLVRLQELSTRTVLRVSFSLTTDREDVRRWFEPRCATFEERLSTIQVLSQAGIAVHATLAPLLPCDPEALAGAALDATERDLVGDPLHVRSVKPHGATTREEAWRIAEKRGFTDWFKPEFQQEISARIDRVARARGRKFVTGPPGFASLARASMEP